MFERTLDSLIKGFRSHRGRDQAAYIAVALNEIRREIRGGDMEVKAEGILKLVYLQMLGHMSAKAAFHIVEVMASTRYHLKFIGYLGAAQCLEPGTDVLILATNLIKKDLTSRSDFDVTAALAGLSHLMTPDLAQHFSNDIIAMLNHNKPNIRKKALVALHSILVHHPESLDKAWVRLQDRLEDPDPGVVSATVTILCELARKDPRPFLPLAPQLFRLLTDSTNNWVLIKVVKLFGSLSTCEPRLSRRLLPPITSIIASTPAMSLLYECIHTIIVGNMLMNAGGDELAQTCVDKLSQFLTDSDQNLKFIALIAMVKILPSHPQMVLPHYDAIAGLLDDEDLSVRLRALTLLTGLAVHGHDFGRFASLLVKFFAPSEHSLSMRIEPSAAALMRKLLAKDQKDGQEERARERYLLSAKADFLREVGLCIVAVGAKDGYASVLNLSLYVEILLKLYSTSTGAFKNLTERIIIDTIARHPQSHAPIARIVKQKEDGLRNLCLCAVRAHLLRQGDQSLSDVSPDALFRGKPRDAVEAQVWLDWHAKERLMKGSTWKPARARKSGRKGCLETRQRFAEAGALSQHAQSRKVALDLTERDALEEPQAAVQQSDQQIFRDVPQPRKRNRTTPALRKGVFALSRLSRQDAAQLNHGFNRQAKSSAPVGRTGEQSVRGREDDVDVPIVLLDQELSLMPDDAETNAFEIAATPVKKVVTKGGARRNARNHA